MNKKVLLIVILVISIVAGISIFISTGKVDGIYRANYSTETINLGPEFGKKPELFTSKFNEFSIVVPPDIKSVWDEPATVTLYGEQNKKIIILRVGTNYESIENHLNDPNLADSSSKISKKEKLMINGLPAMKLFIDNEKGYMIIKDYALYSFTTKDQSLFNTLDQIVQSFKYLGK